MTRRAEFKTLLDKARKEEMGVWKHQIGTRALLKSLMLSLNERMEPKHGAALDMDEEYAVLEIALQQAANGEERREAVEAAVGRISILLDDSELSDDPLPEGPNG